MPWGHHKLILDKVKGDTDKALFFVAQTLENGWSRAMLLNWIDTGLYERSGKALTNFKDTMPETSSDLAQELTKDPYNFAFAGVTQKHNEAQLKEALLGNITKFLIELGTGFAYVGKEYRLEIGDTEKFIDLLFYTKGRGCDARGFYDVNGFTVLKGSIIAKSSVPSFTWKEKRENLLNDYTVSNGDKLELESDKTFPSPSTAADFCIGSSNNGWLVWKDKDGQTLDAVYRKQLE